MLSDGKNRVVLRVEDAQQPSSLGVQGARLMENWRGKDGVLHVELLPAAGATEVNVIIVDQSLRNVQLVVAPPIALDPQRSVQDYLTHWQDLDGDGANTFEEAWIVAVNLMSKAESFTSPAASPPAPRQTP